MYINIYKVPSGLIKRGSCLRSRRMRVGVGWGSRRRKSVVVFRLCSVVARRRQIAQRCVAPLPVTYPPPQDPLGPRPALLRTQSPPTRTAEKRRRHAYGARQIPENGRTSTSLSLTFKSKTQVRAGMLTRGRRETNSMAAMWQALTCDRCITVDEQPRQK